jgi:hypothetical protein
MNEKKYMFVDNENDMMTGYTLSIFSSINTGQMEMDAITPIQGDITVIDTHDSSQEDIFFPDTREHQFLGKELEEFYKKKGYHEH